MVLSDKLNQLEVRTVSCKDTLNYVENKERQRGNQKSFESGIRLNTSNLKVWLGYVEVVAVISQSSLEHT